MVFYFLPAKDPAESRRSDKLICTNRKICRIDRPRAVSGLDNAAGRYTQRLFTFRCALIHLKNSPICQRSLSSTTTVAAPMSCTLPRNPYSSPVALSRRRRRDPQPPLLCAGFPWFNPVFRKSFIPSQRLQPFILRAAHCRFAGQQWRRQIIRLPPSAVATGDGRTSPDSGPCLPAPPHAQTSKSRRCAIASSCVWHRGPRYNARQPA